MGVFISGLGRSVVDYCVLVEKYPENDQKTEAIDRFYGSGSPVPNALSQLAKWGHHVSLISKVGNDRDGRFFLDELKSSEVEINHVITSQQEVTPRAHIWVERGSGKRTIVLDRTIAPLSINELPYDELRASNFLLLDGYEADASIGAAKIVKDSGGKIILDAGSRRDRLDEQLKLADWIIVPLAFAKQVYGSTDLFEVVRDLKKMDSIGAIVTNGAAGCVACWDEFPNAQWFPAIPVEAVDTTGAGDMFHAGFIYGLANNLSVEQSIQWAAAAGALATTKLGGRGFLSTIDDVKNILSED